MNFKKYLLSIFFILVANSICGQNQKFIIQYKLDLEDSINKKTLGYYEYAGGEQTFYDVEWEPVPIKTVRNSMFVTLFKQFTKDQKDYQYFYDDNDSLISLKDILPTVYLNYEAIWDENLNDFHYYPSRNNKDFPFIILELKNKGETYQISYTPSSDISEDIIDISSLYPYSHYTLENYYNGFDLRDINEVLILRMFSGKINKVYNYTDNFSTNTFSENDFENWKLNHLENHSNHFHYNYLYTTKQLDWTRNIGLFNSNENGYYFNVYSDIDDQYLYYLQVDTDAAENKKIVTRGKNQHFKYFQRYKESSSNYAERAVFRVQTVSKIRNTNPPFFDVFSDFYPKIESEKSENYFLQKIKMSYNISRDKTKIGVNFNDEFQKCYFFDSKKDSMYSGYYSKYVKYLTAINKEVLAESLIKLDYTSSVYRHKSFNGFLEKINQEPVKAEKLEQFLAAHIEDKVILDEERLEKKPYFGAGSAVCAYQLTPSELTKENTLFIHQEKIIQSIVEAIKVDTLNNYYIAETGALRIQEKKDFLKSIDSVEKYLGTAIPYDKLTFQLEIYLHPKNMGTELYFFKNSDTTNSYYEKEQYLCLVVPAELSPTKKEYIIAKIRVSEFLDKIVTNDNLLNTESSLSLSEIFQKKIIYGDLKKIMFGNVVNSYRLGLPVYDLTNLEELKKEIPMVEKYIEKVPKTINPRSFE